MIEQNAAKEEIIEVNHGDEGTTVKFQDPNTYELIGFGMLLVTFLAVVVYFWRRKGGKPKA